MGIKSQGNPESTYNAVWTNTAKGAVGPNMPNPYGATGGILIKDGLIRYHVFLGNDDEDPANTACSPQTFTAPEAIPGCCVILVGAGGGAGGSYSPADGATGGEGGGGNGGTASTAGGTNTGGGGGAGDGGAPVQQQSGANGGSGIVMIRYEIAPDMPTSPFAP